MQITSFVLAAFLSLTLPLFTLAEHVGPSRRHSALAHRRRADVELFKRTSGRATFYAVGLGACGQWNNPSDFIVALNTPQFGGGYPGPNCFKSITISYQGKSAQATIMDECPGCPYGGLDMSEGLFTYFEPTSVGVFYMDWSFNDGSSNPAPTTHKTTTTQKPKPTTTSYWVDPSPWTTDTPTSTKTKTKSTSESSYSSTSTSESSSSTVEHNSTSSSSTKTSSTSSTVYASTTAAPLPTVTAVSNIARVNQLVLALAELVRK